MYSMAKNMIYDEAACSFCGKSQSEVGRLIAGANAFICDECVAMCSDIIGRPAKSSSKQINLMKPRRTQGDSGRIRHQPGRGESLPLGRGLQPL